MTRKGTVLKGRFRFRVRTPKCLKPWLPHAGVSGVIDQRFDAEVKHGSQQVRTPNPKHGSQQVRSWRRDACTAQGCPVHGVRALYRLKKGWDNKRGALAAITIGCALCMAKAGTQEKGLGCCAY